MPGLGDVAAAQKDAVCAIDVAARAQQVPDRLHAPAVPVHELTDVSVRRPPPRWDSRSDGPDLVSAHAAFLTAGAHDAKVARHSGGRTAAAFRSQRASP